MTTSFRPIGGAQHPHPRRAAHAAGGESIMRGQLGRALIAAAATVALVAQDAAAQQAVPAFQSRDWRGRPIDYVCNAAAGDSEGLRQALIRHELFRIGADTKAETGWYYGDRLRTARLRTQEATGAE